MPVLRRHGATAPDFASYDYAENLNDRKVKIDKSKSVHLYWKDPSGMELQISLRAPTSAVVSGGDRFVCTLSRRRDRLCSSRVTWPNEKLS
jgi:hypothetical protein